MSNNYWIGKGKAYAQIGEFQVTAFDAATIYGIEIGGVKVSVFGNTDVDGTAAALLTALQASDHPYFTSIVWSVVTDTIQGTAVEAGNPWIAISTVDLGTGTFAAYNQLLENRSPNGWDYDLNWSLGVIPVTGDVVILENSNVSIRWGLEQSAQTLLRFLIKKSFTGKIGLKEKEFAVSANGETTVNTAIEYRQKYLNIKASDVQIGENLQSTTAQGSGLIKLDLDDAVSIVTIYDSASSQETNKPAIQLLANNASTQIFVRKAKGGIGIAVGEAFETSLIASVDIGENMVSNGVQLGAGVTFTSWTQKSGKNFIESAATIALIDCYGGTLNLEGDYTVTECNVGDTGVVNGNNIKTAGDAITTLNMLNGGQMNTLGSAEPRTYNVVNLNKGSRITTDSSIVTMTAINPPSGSFTLALT